MLIGAGRTPETVTIVPLSCCSHIQSVAVGEWEGQRVGLYGGILN